MTTTAKAGLGILLLLLVGAALLLVGLGEGRRMAAAEASLEAQSLERGGTLFRDNCVRCHGVDGRGLPEIAPALNSPEFFTQRLAESRHPGTLRSFIEATVHTGRPANSSGKYSEKMPVFGQAYGGFLRDDEIHDLATFILNWEAGAVSGDAPAVPTAAPAGPPPDPGLSIEMGKVLYTAAECVGCHGAPGSGGVSGPDLAGIGTRGASQVPGLSAEQYIRQSILAPSAVIAPDCPTETCPDIMPRDTWRKLSQRDLDALVQYLLSLK